MLHAVKQMEPEKPLEYNVRKYLLLLATLVATVTSAAGFNPPGGVWEGIDGEQLVDDPIIRSTHYIRYLVFFYCNVTTLALSLVVIVLVLLLAILIDRIEHLIKVLAPLRVVMALDLLGLLGAYIAGTCWDVFTAMYTLILVAAVAFCIVVQMAVTSLPEEKHSGELKERPRKVLMLLATFAMSVTYVAGLSTPGGFWDSTQDGHHAGDPVLQEHHSRRLRAFFACNTTAFVASLLTIVLLLVKKLRESIKIHPYKMYVCIIVALISLMAAYAIGSCRQTDNTVYVCSLGGAIIAYIFFQVVFRGCVMEVEATQTNDSNNMEDPLGPANGSPAPSDGRQSIISVQVNTSELDKARSLVLLLATLASTITYQAAIDPPGGLWQDNKNGHMAGDPILLSTHPGRYKVFFYCNSTAFVASLVVIILVQYRPLVQRHALEAAMILDLFGLIGAYASGSCRDTNTSIYAIALAGAVLIYVVIHVVFFTLDHHDNKPENNKLVDKRRKRLLLFAILATTITYQAGLTPPSRFWPQDDEFGHHAGDPILFSNYPRRYKAFFYCNSVSFMSSIALIILLVNPNLYRPAIRSYALSVCTAAGLFGLMGAYAAGSTQHLKTSIYIFLLVSVLLCLVILLLLVFLVMELKKMKTRTNDTENQPSRAREETRTESTEENQSAVGKDRERKKLHAKHKYLMLLAILAASITYQAGLNPPGGVWQDNSDGHAAGYPVMHDNRRLRYIAFFYSNSTSFMASIVVIILLLPKSLQEEDWRLKPLKTTIVLDLLGLLIAYASGSSRKWETSGYIIALVTAVLGFVAIHVLLSLDRGGKGDIYQHQSQQERQENGQAPHIQQRQNGQH